MTTCWLGDYMQLCRAGTLGPVTTSPLVVTRYVISHHENILGKGFHLLLTPLWQVVQHAPASNPYVKTHVDNYMCDKPRLLGDLPVAVCGLEPAPGGLAGMQQRTTDHVCSLSRCLRCPALLVAGCRP